MQFIKAASPTTAAKHVAEAITKRLARGEHVLWLVSGGSAIQVAVEARQMLGSTSGLVVMQVDERYGPVGHADSNWQKLLDAGFDTNGVVCHPVLTGKSLANTADEYAEKLAAAFRAADFSIGIFGIGADGHTAGILPESPALEGQGLVSFYKAADFERITITPAAIARLDEAVAYANGSEKAQVIKSLKEEKLPLSQQPAGALKLAKNTYVYNDSVGEKI